MTAKAFAPAKVNLTLHVTGQRSDGYHLLDSLVAFADIGDRLTLHAGSELSLKISGEHAQGVPADERNLVWKAAQSVGWLGHIHLEKVLPHGGGIGGGSSDAAAVLRVLGQQGVRIPADLSLSLGADVPVCVVATAARMRGIGELIEPIKLPVLPALLVNPGVAVPTVSVFRALGSRDNPAMPANLATFETPKDVAEWLSAQRNDLERPAKEVAPEITTVLGALAETKDVLLSRMSGSGSTCFALYPSMKAAHMAAYHVGAEHPEWWCQATQLS